MKMKYIKQITLIFLVIFTFLVCRVVIFNNPVTLFLLAEEFNEPSTPYYFITDRIYKLQAKNDFSDRILTYLANKKYGNLQYRFIRFLGIAGDSRALPILFQLYEKYKNDPNNLHKIHEIIRSFGFISDPQSVHYLEIILRESDHTIANKLKPTIVSSLFYLTGNTDYRSFSSSKEEEILYLTKNQIDARAVITATKGNNRTYEEMHILTKTYQASIEETGLMIYF
jgi:hypothetical protein